MLPPALVERTLGRVAEEFARTGPPPDFPAFPDIPAGRYTDPEFFALEQEHLWRSAWVCAGRESDLDGPHAFRRFDRLGVPLVLVRGADDRIRCFANTCRHRGAPVVRDTCGTAKRLRCQYHSWTYDADDGSLVVVPDERDFVGLDTSERGLHEYRCETWAGFVFVSLDSDAPPLLDHLGVIADEFAHLRVHEYRTVDIDERVLSCNWKVAVEAFCEVYHFRFIHDRGGVTLLDSRGAVMSLLPNGNSRMVVPFSAPVAEAQGMSSWRDLQTLPDRYGLPVVDGVHPLVHCTSTSYGIFPNFITPIAPNGFPIHLFWPVDVDTTLLQVIHYGPDWGDGDRPAGWDQRLAGFAKVIDEDVANLAPMQASLRNPSFTGVPLNYQERRIWHFNEAVDRAIGEDRIPAHLRVPALLDDFVEGPEPQEVP